MTDLGTTRRANTVPPSAINERGQIIGYSISNTVSTHAVCGEGKCTRLGTFAGPENCPYGINERGPGRWFLFKMHRAAPLGSFSRHPTPNFRTCLAGPEKRKRRPWQEDAEPGKDWQTSFQFVPRAAKRTRPHENRQSQFAHICGPSSFHARIKNGKVAKG